ncbi:hypothetical protein QTP88_012010 [Uroleucon formosanum]
MKQATAALILLRTLTEQLSNVDDKVYSALNVIENTIDNKSQILSQKKVNLLKIIEKGEKKKQDIAKDFGIPASTLSTIIKNKDVILKNFNENSATRKKMKLGEYSDIESCLLKWFQQCLDRKIPINGTILREKAEEFGHKLGHEHFKASSGWLTNWKIRNSVVFKQVCGESGAVDVQKCSVWINNLPKLIENYSPDDIFNVDETGLFFKCLPTKHSYLKANFVQVENIVKKE